MKYKTGSSVSVCTPYVTSYKPWLKPVINDVYYYVQCDATSTAYANCSAVLSVNQMLFAKHMICKSVHVVWRYVPGHQRYLGYGITVQHIITQYGGVSTA